MFFDSPRPRAAFRALAPLSAPSRRFPRPRAAFRALAPLSALPLMLWLATSPAVAQTTGYNVSGTVMLDSISPNAPAQNITFTFASVNHSNTFSMTLPIDSSGAFSIPNVPADNYTLSVKGAKWLRANVAVDTTSGNVSNVSVLLPGGDSDNNNTVDVLDFGNLVNAYGDTYTLNDPNADPSDIATDFNCDGSVDVLDFGILVNNYGGAGLEYAGLLMAKVVNQNVVLTWSGSAGMSNGSVYHVYRSTQSGNYALPTPTQPNNPGRLVYSGPATTFNDPVATLPNAAVYYIVKPYNTGGEYGATNEAEAEGWSLYHINCGGNASGAFATDNYFTGGNIVSTTTPPDTTTVSNPAPAAVYQTARASDMINPHFSYTLPNLTPGTPYLVRLHLFDPDSTEPYQRQFNITMNGTLVESVFDIFGWVGGTGQAVAADYVTTADATGKIEIDFDATIGIAVCSGIEVMTVGATAPTNVQGYATADSQITLYWDATPGAIGYNIYRGFAEGGEDMLHPINGATPVNTLSFAGSKTAIYTDTTNVVDGTDYYYVVKAVYPNGVSVASDEGIAAASSFSIPWDSHNAGQILGAISGILSDNLTDCDPLTEMVAVGPDGSVYDMNVGTIDVYGEFNGSTAEFITADGDVFNVPEDGGSPIPDALSLVHHLTEINTPNMPGAKGPQRRIATTTGYDAIRGDFNLMAPALKDLIWTTDPNKAMQDPLHYKLVTGQTAQKATELDGNHVIDDPEVHLGSHVTYKSPTGKIKSSEAEGVLSYGKNGWGLYLVVNGSKFYTQPLPSLTAGNKYAPHERKLVAGTHVGRFTTGEEVNMTFATRYKDLQGGYHSDLCLIEAFDALAPGDGPHIAIFGTRPYTGKDDTYDQYTVLKRVHAIAQVFGGNPPHGNIMPTGSSWFGGRWGNSHFIATGNGDNVGPGQARKRDNTHQWVLLNASNTYNNIHPATVKGIFGNEPTYYDLGFVGPTPNMPRATVSWMGEYCAPARSTGYAFEDMINISIYPR